MNKVFLIGRLTKDIELRYSQSQLAVANFSIAVNRGKDKNGEDKGADFPNCIAFGKTAENINKFCGKGKKIAVEGHIQTGSYENKEGNKVYTTEVIVDRTEFIDFSKDIKAVDNDSSSQIPEGFEEVTDDDVPF